MAIGNFLTTQETAKKLKVSIGRVHQFVTNERLKPSQKIGTVLFFDKAEVDRFAKTPRKNGRPKNTSKKN